MWDIINDKNLTPGIADEILSNLPAPLGDFYANLQQFSQEGISFNFVTVWVPITF